jgi:hypothetical protein
MMLFFAMLLACVQPDPARFDSALAWARNGDQKAASIGFVAALDDGLVHPATYHGLGNALYRQDDRGRAIAAWRRGLFLSPRDGDIASNLDRVRKETTDQVEPPAHHRVAFFWAKALSPMETGLAGAALIGLGFTLLLIGRIRRWARPPAPSSRPWLALGAIGLGLLLGASAHDTLQLRQGAVVIATEVEVRSALGKAGVSLFVLHEGTELKVVDHTASHKLVVLSDGRKGWLPRAALLSTNPLDPFPLANPGRL